MTFQRIYEVVKTIPRGKTMTYGEVAKRAGAHPRVVGWALNKNPDPQNIPCHRVVFKDGGLSKGFAFGGIAAQRARLVAEGVDFAGDKVCS
jgi:methylated-DNA-protein-cysteine methyltransferase-like protein